MMTTIIMLLLFVIMALLDGVYNFPINYGDAASKFDDFKHQGNQIW